MSRGLLRGHWLGLGPQARFPEGLACWGNGTGQGTWSESQPFQCAGFLPRPRKVTGTDLICSDCVGERGPARAELGFRPAEGTGAGEGVGGAGASAVHGVGTPRPWPCGFHTGAVSAAGGAAVGPSSHSDQGGASASLDSGISE